MANLLDSGARRDFGTGAVRDVAEGKGRCDLLPLKVVSDITDDGIPAEIELYIRTGDLNYLRKAIIVFAEIAFGNIWTALLETAKQYEDGARKYADRNWEKGINSHVFIDSGVRHYLKWRRGDEDEPHDRAFLWNMLGAIWTHENKPELIDLPFALTISTIPPSECSSMSTKWDEMSNKELSDAVCNIGLCSACTSDRKFDCPFLDCDCSNCLAEYPDFRRIAIEYLEKEGKA